MVEKEVVGRLRISFEMIDLRYEIFNKTSPLKRGARGVFGLLIILFISSCSTEPQQKKTTKKPKAKIYSVILDNSSSTNEEEDSYEDLKED